MSKLSEFELLELTLHESESRLHAVLGAGLKKITGPALLDQHLPMWSPSFFGLEKSSVFRTASEETQSNIIRRCSIDVLHEAFFIEESGMAFASKMSLLSETREERMLYNLFAADEATHFHWVQNALGAIQLICSLINFIGLLESVIRDGQRESLVFIIQVILEGWGLAHYRSLLRECGHAGFRDVLERILRDEARHHGSGVVLCRERGLPDRARGEVIETMRSFLEMVRFGPQSVLAAIDEELGGLNKEQKRRTLEELECENHSLSRLNHLRELMMQEGFESIVAELSDHGAFTPYPVEACL